MILSHCLFPFACLALKYSTREVDSFSPLRVFLNSFGESHFLISEGAEEMTSKASCPNPRLVRFLQKNLLGANDTLAGHLDSAGIPWVERGYMVSKLKMICPL